MPRISFFRRDMLKPGTYDEMRRVSILRAAGLSYETIGILVDRSQSTIHRWLNPDAYRCHLEYNAQWKRAKRRRLKNLEPTKGEPPTIIGVNEMTNEQIAKLVAELKATFCPFLHRLCDALEKIARG